MLRGTNLFCDSDLGYLPKYNHLGINFSNMAQTKLTIQTFIKESLEKRKTLVNAVSA